MDQRVTTPMSAVRSEVSDIEIVREALKSEYEVLEELGRGGMAVVYRARERQLDRDVAIKVLPMSLAFDAEFVERFQREARTAAKLEHPNIIPIYRVGQSDRVSYFVMKYLRGKALAELIEQRGALPPEEIRRLLEQAARALGYAHKHGIVHRDVKPDNIMLDDAGHAVVTDFGIAKAASGGRLTGTGMSIGTPHYMSPEQARAKSIDGRSDLYSLGVVAYQCLTGRVPFDGEDAFAIGYKHVMDPVPTPVLETAEQRALFVVIRRMLAKSPKDRYPSADALVAALGQRRSATTLGDAPTQIVSRSSVPARAAATKGAVPTPTTPIPRIDPRQPARRRSSPQRTRGAALVGFLILFVLGGGGAGGYWYLLLGSEWPPRFPSAQTTFATLWTAVRGDAAVAQVPPAVAPAPAPVQIPVVDSLAADTAVRDSVPPPAADAPSTNTTPAAELPNTGTLELRGAPTFGKVTVDGEALTGSVLTVPAGSHRIRVTALGYEDYTSTVPVGRGERIIVQVEMRRAEPSASTPVGRVFSRNETDDDCELPGPNYNGQGSCYDAPPVTTQRPVVPLPAGVKVAPPPAVLWLRVEAEGRVNRIIPAGKTDLRFARVAAQTAKQMQFQPAQKDGRPVAGWIRMTFEAEPGR